MKRQRNIQQVKDYDKCPPNQTKEGDIKSLPEKEFRIMKVQMIKNIENKMELQINRLETRIEKENQSVMDNTITEIKSTLDITNSRITEAEEVISEVEGRMLKITEAERKKVKKN